MIKKKIYSRFNLITGLIALSLLLRFVTVYFIRDLEIDNEWNVLVTNLVKYNSYSIYLFDNQPIPSVYMPPAYPFFIYIIKSITSFEGLNLINFVIFIQIILSTYSVYLFYKVNQIFFSKKLSLINSFIFSIIPLNLYAPGQISSINIQIFFSILFLNFLFLIIRNQTNKNIVLFSLLSGILILTRGEFILIFALLTFYIFLKKKIKLVNFIKIIIVTILIISPYVLRNYLHFEQIFIVKSVGFNLWKGNNELSTVDGFETLERIEFKNLKMKLDAVEKDKYYEIKRDNIFLQEALVNLKNDPYKYFVLSIKRFFSFYFIDINSKYTNYFNIFHILPIIILSITSLPGLMIFFKTKKIENKCIGIYLLINLLIFSIFFIIPRYKLVILPIQLVLTTYFIQAFLNKIKSKFI